MTKRHIANAMYIAKRMKRGGYVRGGGPDIPPMEDPRNWLELGGEKPISPSIDQRLGIGTDAGEAVVQPLSGQGMPSRQSQQSPQAVNQLFNSPGMTQWREKSVIPASKVEDRYYTGTSKDKDFPDFNVGRHGAWFTKNPADASMYAQQNDSKGYKRQGWDYVPVNTADRVIPAYLRAENPYTGPLPDIAYAQNYKKAQSDWFDQLRAQGHDAWMPKNAPDLAVILKNASDIKSAISNSGDFDRGAKRIDRDDGGRAGYFDGGMPEVIDLETEVPDSSSSYDSSEDTPANFFRQDKELQQSHPEMFQQKTYAPYTGLDDEPAPARQPSSRPMAYAPSDTSSRGPAMDAINDTASAGWGNAPRPVPPGNIPNRPITNRVDPRLVRILDTAGTTLPEGWSFDITSGHRPGSQGFHSSGNAVDVRLKDDQGRILPNYQNAAAFRAYEQFAQAARKAQLDLHPELSNQLRWGGYFSGPVGKYGAKDLMHFDLGGDRVPMGGGSWETGLHERERRYLPGAKSVGMGNYAKGGSIADRAIMVMSRQAKRQPGRG